MNNEEITQELENEIENSEAVQWETSETEKIYIENKEEIERETKKWDNWRKRQRIKKGILKVVEPAAFVLIVAAVGSALIGGFTEIFSNVAGLGYVEQDLKTQGIEYKKTVRNFNFYNDENANYLYGTVLDKQGQEWDVYYDLRGTKHGKIKDPVNFANAARELEPIVVEREREIPEELSK